MIIKQLVLFILVIFGENLYAGSWANPQIKDYSSENKEYVLRIYPTYKPEKYDKWKHSNPKKSKRFKAKDTTMVFCHAILYKTVETDTVRVWEKRLLNEKAPATAIVANDGKSIVTFDDWYVVDHGINAMVLYDESGQLIKKYRLEEISPFPINDYRRSYFLILHWRSGERYIDNNRVEIRFHDEAGNSKIRVYNLKTEVFE